MSAKKIIKTKIVAKKVVVDKSDLAANKLRATIKSTVSPFNRFSKLSESVVRSKLSTEKRSTKVTRPSTSTSMLKLMPKTPVKKQIGNQKFGKFQNGT